MDETRVDLTQWRGLYDVAARVWALAPWEFMDERFGFELRKVRRLSALEPAKKSLLRTFGSR